MHERIGVVKHSDAVKVYVASACSIQNLRCIIKAEGRYPPQGNFPGNTSMHGKLAWRETRDKKRAERDRCGRMTSLSDARKAELGSEHAIRNNRSGTKD